MYIVIAHHNIDITFQKNTNNFLKREQRREQNSPQNVIDFQ